MEPSLPQLILPIKLERSPERLTSLGGLVVLEELARAAGVWEKVDRVLKGPQSGRGYQPHEFVQPLVWMLHAGGRRLEDLRELRGEHEVAGAVGTGGGARCGDGGGLAAPARAGGGGGDAARESPTGGGRFAADAGGKDCSRGSNRGGNGTPVPTVNITRYIGHAAFVGTIKPDVNKRAEHVFQCDVNSCDNE